jgi:hypothetical protein
MGPERYSCRCGEKYRTGATEWIHLGERERQKRIQETAAMGFLFSLLISILSVPAYLVLRFAFHRSREALAIGLLITTFPFFLIVLQLALDVAASVWRTRSGGIS